MFYVGARQSADVVNMLTSAERILEYCQLEPEKQPDEPKEVSESWPTEGKIEFRKIFYRYFKDSKPVLRNLSFVIKPMEKIGTIFLNSTGYTCNFSIFVTKNSIFDFKKESSVVRELVRVH